MADRRNHSQREALLRRVGGEFTEMPCLRLTRAQAQRLFDLRTDLATGSSPPSFKKGG